MPPQPAAAQPMPPQPAPAALPAAATPPVAVQEFMEVVRKSNKRHRSIVQLFQLPVLYRYDIISEEGEDKMRRAREEEEEKRSKRQKEKDQSEGWQVVTTGPSNKSTQQEGIQTSNTFASLHNSP
jgi:hypothetical protein